MRTEKGMHRIGLSACAVGRMCIGAVALAAVVAGCRPSSSASSSATEQASQENRWEATMKQPFEQPLVEIMEEISAKYEKLTDLSLKRNLTGWALGKNCVTVTFILNSPEAQKAFREQIVASPLVVFEGPTEPSRNDGVGVNDTLGIRLQSDHPVYSTQADRATFTLLNQSQTSLECGDSYHITYEDEKGVWRTLPMHTAFFAIAYDVPPGGKKQLAGDLYPEVHANKPGRYRFFYKVTLTDSGKDLLLMAEFRLSEP